MVSAFGNSDTKFLTFEPLELCDKLKLLLQKKQAKNISDLISKEIIAIVDSLSEYRCISTKQHEILLLKCSN